MIPEGVSETLRADLVASGARVHFEFPRWLRPLIFRDVAAITIGRRIYVTSRMIERPAAEIEALLRHELVHVRQAVRLGIAAFLCRYGIEYVRLRFRGRTRAQAYREISFEQEAFEAEEE